MAVLETSLQVHKMGFPLETSPADQQKLPLESDDRDKSEMYLVALVHLLS